MGQASRGFPLRFRQSVCDGTRPYVVGILNVTPDSFSDGGAYPTPQAAIERASELERQGADWIDIGGESTRPGARPLEAKVELGRVLPILEALAGRIRVPLSVDTYKAEVAEAALAAGAEVVNDVSGGRLDPAILDVVGRRGATLVLGHLRGRPETMQREVHFQDVFHEVAEELAERVTAATDAGVESIVVDPGLGFGKRTFETTVLLARSGELGRLLGRPIMIGASRKSFLAELSGIEKPASRLAPSLAAALVAAQAGAHFLRVHDVAETCAALAVLAAARRAQGEESREEEAAS